jgi:hypothetical protein
VRHRNNIRLQKQIHAIHDCENSNLFFRSNSHEVQNIKLRQKFLWFPLFQKSHQELLLVECHRTLNLRRPRHATQEHDAIFRKFCQFLDCCNILRPKVGWNKTSSVFHLEEWPERLMWRIKAGIKTGDYLKETINGCSNFILLFFGVLRGVCILRHVVFAA